MSLIAYIAANLGQLLVREPWEGEGPIVDSCVINATPEIMPITGGISSIKGHFIWVSFSSPVAPSERRRFWNRRGKAIFVVW